MSPHLLPFHVEVMAESDTVTGRVGRPLVVETLRAFGMDTIIARELKVRERAGGDSETAMVEAVALMLAAGGDGVADINVLKADAGLCRRLGRTLPSEDALFDFLDRFHRDALIQQAHQSRTPDQVADIPEENEPLKGRGRVCEEDVRRVARPLHGTVATLDHDATIQACHKQPALPHDKGGRGYQPSAMLWAELGLAIADEYRDGNVPAALSNLPRIKRGLAARPATVVEKYFRADRACYEAPGLQWRAHPDRQDGPTGHIGFAISADMGDDLRKRCKEVPAAEWTLFDDRVDETLEGAEVECAPGNWPKDSWPLRSVALRIRKKQGQLFASGDDTKSLAVVSNREEAMSGEEIIRWHRKKAGTIELMHDVSKNERGAAVPPSGKCGANAAWSRMSLLTLNVLTAMKLHALPEALRAARPKRLRYVVFTLAGKLIWHADRLVVQIAEPAERLAGLIAARAKLAVLRPQFSSA